MIPLKTTAIKKDRLVGIEFLRFFSSFSILVWHFQHFSLIPFDRSVQPFYSFLGIFYEHGSVGVNIFWCISGFVFFFNYLEKIQSRKVTFLNFSISRLSRLYPLHFVTLIIVLFLQLYFEKINGFAFTYIYDFKHFILNIFFASGWGIEDRFSFNGPIWSVSIEIIVYIIFFIAFFRFRIFSAYLFFIVLFIIFLVLSPTDGSIAHALFYFFIGGLITISKYHMNKITSNQFLKNYTFYILGLFMLVCLITTWKIDFSYSKSFTHFFVISLVYFFVLINKLFTYHYKIWIFLGNLTYSSYLIHFPIQLILMILLQKLNYDINIDSYGLFLFFMLSTLFLSKYVYKFFEMPMQNLIRSKFIK